MIEDELETGELNPETIFNEGLDAGMLQFQEQLTDTLAAEGMSQEEIEAFFDPAPRRGKHRRGKVKHCSAKQWAKMPQVCGGSRRRYDPAPRTMKRTSYHISAPDYKGVHHTWRTIPAHSRRTYDPAPVRHYGKKAKGLVAGLRPMVLPAAVLATVYSKYVDRSAALHTAGAQINGHVVDGVIDAVQYDLKNRPTTSIMDRLKQNASEIITPALLGVGVKYAAKKVKLHPKVNQVAGLLGDAAIGSSIGKLISHILDPPNNAIQNTNTGVQITMQSVQHTQTQAAPVTSYSTPGGYF